METNFDLIIVGGGVLGTFHAYHALNSGLRVALIEKNARPMDATVRNFGQVVPSGFGSEWQQYGRESLRIYKSIQEQFDISVRQNGSVYIASNNEEMTLINELAQINKKNDYESCLLTKEECLNKYPGLRSDYALGGLFFPEEITIEPAIMIHRLQRFLRERHNLHIFYNKLVINCEEQRGNVTVETAQGNKWTAEKAILCNGSEFKLLYPEVFAQSQIEVTKLQMLRTKPQPNYKLDGSILTGLSIRRYESFYECPSFFDIKQRENPQNPEKKWGVHILFKQASDSSVILGDSHIYAPADQLEDLGYENEEVIDDFIIAESKKIIDLPTYEIQNRWIGFYSQCKDKAIYTHDVSDNIHIATAIGGKGMTAGAGFAKKNIEKLLNI